MRANITPYACGMNQTAQYACIGCNQEGKAPRGTAKHVPVDRHEKFVPEKKGGEVRNRRVSGGTGEPITRAERPDSCGRTSRLATVQTKPPVTPLWDRSHPCPGCKTIIKGHHWCRPCDRARKSDNPEAALAEVRRMRKAGMIHKGYPKGRTRHRAHRQTMEGV